MSAGIFAEWQPKYADCGIPTFPVEFREGGKKPAVRGYLQIGMPYSNQLAIKFPTNDAFGFGLRRAKIAVLDVDTADERVRDDAFARHGEPAIAVRTISGHWQGWYRHNGERRQVKPWPGLPIDVLGHGYVCAPPSRGPAGQYDFIQGGLEDLDHLTVLRDLGLRSRPRAAERVAEGARNNSLFEYAMRVANGCSSIGELLVAARNFMQTALDVTGMTHPYTEAELRATVGRVWRYETEGRNQFGRYGAATISHDMIKRMAGDADAFALYASLRAQHGLVDRFPLAAAMADLLGWRVARYRQPRDRLVAVHGVLRCVHRGGRGPKDPPIYRWA
jgi:Bifunctional DNA primase/polymerase, N-terminal